MASTARDDSGKHWRGENPRTFIHVDAPDETGYFRAMNAVVRPKYEVPVLTNEAIEVHLASLREGQDELREDVRELRADNKSSATKSTPCIRR